jgi:hypothetical protein
MVWDRWGAQSGKVSLSLRKIEVFEGPGDPHGSPGRGLRPSRDQVWATKSTLGMRERRFRALKRRFWATSGAQATILGNFGCQNLTQWTIFDQFWERKSDLSACIRYKSYDFMLRVEMCFEKRADVRSDRSLAFFFRGRRQWPQASLSADPRVRRVGRLGKLPEETVENGSLESSTGRWGLGVPNCTHRSRWASNPLQYYDVSCTWGPQVREWDTCGNLRVPSGRFRSVPRVLRDAPKRS